MSTKLKGKCPITNEQCYLLVFNNEERYECQGIGVLTNYDSIPKCPIASERGILSSRYINYPICFFCNINNGLRKGFISNRYLIYTCVHCFDKLKNQKMKCLEVK